MNTSELMPPNAVADIYVIDEPGVPDYYYRARIVSLDALGVSFVIDGKRPNFETIFIPWSQIIRLVTEDVSYSKLDRAGVTL